MSNRRARAAAALVSCLVHAAILWRLAGVEIAPPADLEIPPPVRVVLRQPPPPAAPPPKRPPLPPPPAPAAAVPEIPPPAAAPEAPPPVVPEAAKEKPPELEIPLPEQQIVAVPEGGREEPPPDTRLLSDRDNRVDQQMVRKGEPEASREDADAAAQADDSGDGDAAEDAPAPPPPAPPRAVDAPLPGLRELLPGALVLAARQRDLPVEQPTPAKAAGGGARRVRRAEDWQPQTTLRGSLDYLPDVQPGHLTLLNTKADLFAPFVRRVMTRVFQNMLILLRRAAPSIRGGRERVQAEALMDRDGRMIGITIQERSTTMAIGLDRMLREACDAAFFDRNPPPGAESADGKIHFVLETVIEAIPSERGVEISGLFGVGLL